MPDVGITSNLIFLDVITSNLTFSGAGVGGGGCEESRGAARDGARDAPGLDY